MSVPITTGGTSPGIRRSIAGAALVALLAACHPAEPPLAPLPDAPPPRVGDANGSTLARPAGGPPAPTLSYAGTQTGRLGRRAASENGDISLDFVDGDIREIVATVLGKLLEVPYTIDPAVQGTVTVTTPKPVSRAAALSILRSLLAQRGAVLVENRGLYEVLSQAQALNRPLEGDLGSGEGGAEIVTLHYASAPDLLKLIQPFVSKSSKVAAEPGQNAIVVSGDPLARGTVVDLIRSFDVDALAGQSYALFPVSSGSPEKVAGELETVLKTGKDQALAGQVRVLPMPRINAVLVASSQRRYLDEARRLLDLVDRASASSQPGWHVYYVQNGQATSLEYILQRAFTPDRVTATGASDTHRLAADAGSGGARNGQSGQGATGGGAGGQGDSGSLGALPVDPTSQDQPAQVTAAALEPLSGGAGGGDADKNAGGPRMRVIASRQNNALLIYASPEDYAVIDSMLKKIDILPLQVRIDATIAEVTLTNELRYGTQFFFKHGGLAGELNSTSGTTPIQLNTGGVGGVVTSTSTSFGVGNLTEATPNFLLNFGSRAVDVALNALKDVTEVRVLSSPQVSVLDNELARIEVGDEVPYQSESAQSTVGSGSPIVSSISYRQSGVKLEIIPRVNASGLVALDIAQQISTPVRTTSSGIDSPTFQNRTVRSRVVVQDGQTLGVAGLIRDTDSHENQGVPLLKDIPVLGSLFSSQDNNRTRTELIVLLTPHVIYDQRGARLLTDDLRNALDNAARVPGRLGSLPIGTSADPNAALGR